MLVFHKESVYDIQGLCNFAFIAGINDRFYNMMITGNLTWLSVDMQCTMKLCDYEWQKRKMVLL